MAVAPMAITTSRERVVDFTLPYKQLSYGILIKKPAQQSSIFLFTTPFQPWVWLMFFVAFLVVSITLSTLDKLSPSKAIRDGSPSFHLKESLWLFYASLVRAGSEWTPRTISGQVLCGVWWFFTLITVSTYTANLAASLTVTRLETTIKSLDDLRRQTTIRYGTVENSQTEEFFKSSRNRDYQEMWKAMSEITIGSIVKNSSVAVRKVLTEKYAFLWDRPTLQYIAEEKECGTVLIPDSFDRKDYGIALPHRSPYRDDLSMALLKLNEKGILSKLEHK